MVTTRRPMQHEGKAERKGVEAFLMERRRGGRGGRSHVAIEEAPQVWKENASANRLVLTWLSHKKGTEKRENAI